MMDRYVAWLKENGATFDAIDWPVQTPHTGRGAIATKDVLPDQSFLTIPSKLIIDPPLCRRAPDIGGFLSSHRVFMESDELTLAVYLCHERLKGKLSFWEPYIDSLPKDTGSIYTWSREELEELQDPGLVEEAMETGPRERRQVYDRIIAVIKAGSGPFKQITNEKTLKYELFSWALESVCCRSFGRRLRYISLVPLADNLNHSNVQTKYSYDGTVFKLFPSGKNVVRKGTEAFNSYGRRSNANLLLSYGFALDDNEWDELSIALGLPDSSPYVDKKRVLMPGPVVAKLKQGEIPFFLLVFFRINCATEEEIRAFYAATEPPVSWVSCSFLNLKNERSALKAAVEEVEEILGSFSTTEDQDRQTLRNGSVPIRKLFAIRYRIGRKRVLRLNAEYLKKLVKIVDCMNEQIQKEGKSEDARTIDLAIKKRYELAQERMMDAIRANRSVEDLTTLLASM